MEKRWTTITRPSSTIVVVGCFVFFTLVICALAVLWKLPGRHVAPEANALYQLTYHIWLLVEELDNQAFSFRDLNNPEFVRLLQTTQDGSGVIKPLSVNSEGVIVDPWGNPIIMFYFPTSVPDDVKDPCLERISRRFRVAAWSTGGDGQNEYGTGNDIFIGIRQDGSTTGDPSTWVAVKRRGLRALFE